MVLRKSFKAFVLYLSLMMVNFKYMYVSGDKYWKINGIRYSIYYKSYSNVSRIRCVACCDRDSQCASVNFNDVAMECELTDHYPPDLSLLPVYSATWDVFYRPIGNATKVQGIRTWQSSTEAWGESGLAIDGNTNVNYYSGSCAHTLESTTNFWAMEFNKTSPVRSVEIWWRTDCCMFERTREVQILVSRTQEECDNNIGEVCGYFVGPATLETNPSIITCEAAVYGNFLKLLQYCDTFLSICEVFVYSD